MLSSLPAPNPKGLNAAIIGGGLMGHALAAVFLSGGAEVTVVESSPLGRETLKDRVALILDAMKAQADAITRLAVVSSHEKVTPRCRLVVEAIPEDLALKQALFCALEKDLPLAMLATNSSVYRVGDVADGLRDKSRAIGTHWWNPPHLVPIVEVIQGEQTNPEAILWMLELLHALGKTPVHVRKDTPGFIGNRLQHALWREAISLLEEGIADAATIDMVARQTLGLKLAALGPLENADYVGLDLTLAIHEYVFPVLSRSTAPSPLVSDAVRAGKLGAKSGEGLLQWPQGRRGEVARRLAGQLTKATAREDEAGWL